MLHAKLRLGYRESGVGFRPEKGLSQFDIARFLGRCRLTADLPACFETLGFSLLRVALQLSIYGLAFGLNIGTRSLRFHFLQTEILWFMCALRFDK